jgi:hypothetical protein
MVVDLARYKDTFWRRIPNPVDIRQGIADATHRIRSQTIAPVSEDGRDMGFASSRDPKIFRDRASWRSGDG